MTSCMMHIISTNSARCTKCTSWCTKWMYDNKNVQNKCITIKYICICKHDSLYSHRDRKKMYHNHNVGRKTTTRSFFLSWFICKWLSYKQEAQKYTSFLCSQESNSTISRLVITACIRVRSRRHIRASLMYTHSRKSAPMQLAIMCIGLIKEAKKNTLVKNVLVLYVR